MSADYSPFVSSALSLYKTLWAGRPTQETRPSFLTDRLLACVYGAGGREGTGGRPGAM